MKQFSLVFATLGGTVCSLLAMDWSQFGSSLVLSAFGALVSFSVSYGLTRLFKKKKA